MQRQLAADTSHLLGKIGPRTRGVENELVADGSAQKGMHRLGFELPKQIPKGKIDSGKGIHHKPFAAIKLGGKIHLVPDGADVRDIAAFEKS